MDNYKKQLKINKYSLDEELTNQSQLFMSWAASYAEASIDREIAKNQLDLIKAKVENTIRNDPDMKKNKLTESAISSKVTRSKKVQQYVTKYLSVLKVEKILLEAKNAFKQRQKMLEGLVQLHIQSYYSDPKVKISNELFDTVQQKKESNLKQASKEIRKSLKIRRRRDGSD